MTDEYKDIFYDSETSFEDFVRICIKNRISLNKDSNIDIDFFKNKKYNHILNNTESKKMIDVYLNDIITEADLLEFYNNQTPDEFVFDRIKCITEEINKTYDKIKYSEIFLNKANDFENKLTEFMSYNSIDLIFVNEISHIIQEIKDELSIDKLNENLKYLNQQLVYFNELDENEKNKKYYEMLENCALNLQCTAGMIVANINEYKKCVKLIDDVESILNNLK